ncbi:MAG: response regulator [Lewinellaceae bacterium]|nr:response regulator [Phaeodactylibacter sp.]MCB9037029.1 response regulator [Lewinellaceae bacterium]
MAPFVRYTILTGKLLLLLPLSFFAQTKTLPFQLISAGSGQDINFIYNITQDQQGFLWFGTLNGLVRYDGYNCRNYNNADGSGLKGRKVTGVKEDRYGHLWVVSDYWLQAYDPVSDSFYDMDNLDGDTVFQYSNTKINPIMAEDGQGIIWMCSNNGLFSINPHQNAGQSIIRVYRADPTASFNVQVVFPDSHDRLWIGTGKGLYAFNREQERIETCPLGVEAPVISLCETAEGKLCVGMAGEGFGIYNPATQDFSRFVHNEKDTTSLAGESVYQIARDGKNNIWLLAGSFESRAFSLQRLDAHGTSFQTYFRDQKTEGGVASLGGIGFFLFKSRAGHLWFVGKKGLQLFDPYLEVTYDIREREKHAIDWSGIFSFYEDRTGVIWIGTASTGLLKFAPSAYKFNVFMPTPEEIENQTISFAFPMFEDSRGYLWKKALNGTNRYFFDSHRGLQIAVHYPFQMGSFLQDRNDMLWLTTSEETKRFDLKTGKLLRSNVEVPGAKCLQDREGWIWSATYGQGLFRFNPSSGEVINFRHEPGNPNSISSDYLGGVMLEDSDGTIWAGGYGGLKKYNPKTGNFSAYLEDITVDDMHSDNSDGIWLGTPGMGLYHFDKKTGLAQKYSKKEGFPTNRFKAVREDDHGDLWISSDVGLIHFRPGADTSTWHVYNEQDGLPTSVFSYGACKRKNGEMIFSLWGGAFILFHPDSLQDDTFLPEAAFVDFKLFNRPVEIGVKNSPLASSIWTTDHLVLRHDQNVFSLEYTAFHFAAPEQNEFAYRMEGIDQDWHNVGNRHTVNFAGLQPGEYTFRVKAANHDGLWGEEKALQITILPPWWETWWAYSCYALSTAGLLWAIYNWRKRRWQLKAQLALEQQEAVRLKELDQFKTNFYTNITHEFRTPLTIILGMVEQVKNDPEKWYNEGLQMIRRSGNNLLRLVNQMLDLSKVEAGVLPVNMVQGDVIAYLKYVLESFHSLAENKDITVHFQSDKEALVMDYDPEKLREIMSNLLSNAIKFTPKGGSVKVEVRSLPGRAPYLMEVGAKTGAKLEKPGDLPLGLRVVVTDNGKGISKERLDKIFGRFYSNADPQAGESGGAGIGLALTQELVKLLGGEITVQSEVGKGSQFTVTLPIANEAKLENPPEIEPDPGKARSPIGEKEQVAGAGEDVPHLLIIEDNRDVVRYLFSILEQDYQLEVAENGKEGLEKALETIPDIILSDVMMPEMDGFELCDKLKMDFRTSHIPIILLTAKADMPSRIEGLERGADAYLAKPFHKEELQVRLHKLLEIRKQLQERYASLPSAGSRPPSVEYEIEDAFMKQVRDILEAHLSDEYFGILDLCKELGMSRPQFYRKFKALSGQTVGQYFRSLRLDKAKALLLATSLHISEIAYEVGFKDPAYFTRVFKEEFGVNPSEVRK